MVYMRYNIEKENIYFQSKYIVFDIQLINQTQGNKHFYT